VDNEQLYLFGLKKDPITQKGRFKVILPLDTLIFLSVALIILFVIFFSLGVEKGKKFASAVIAQTPTETVSNNQDKQKSALRLPLPKEQGNLAQPKEKTDTKNIDKLKDAFHIQIASFGKENAAQKEAESLIKTGYSVEIRKSGKYVVVYVGGFTNRKEAAEKMKSLKKKYKDCILRRL